MIQPPQGTREPKEQVPAWIADPAVTEQFDNELAKVRSGGPADRRPPQRVAFDDTSPQPAKKIPDPGARRTDPATPRHAFQGPLPVPPRVSAEAMRTVGDILGSGAAMAVRLAPAAALLLPLKGDTASETIDVPGRPDLYGEIDGKDLTIFQRGREHWWGLWHDRTLLTTLGTKTEYPHGVLLGQVLDANGQVIGAIENWHLSPTPELFAALAARARELAAASPDDPDAKPRKPNVAVPQTVVPPDGESLSPDNRTPAGQSTWGFDKAPAAADRDRHLAVATVDVIARLLKTGKIWLDTPARIQATKPEYRDGWATWELYDSWTGAVFGHVRVSVHSRNNPGPPSVELNTKAAELWGGVVEVEAPFSIVEESLTKVVETWTGEFGRKLEEVRAHLFKDNLSQFQVEFARVRAENPNFTPQQIGNLAIRNLSAAKAAIRLGFDELRAHMDFYGNVSIDGRQLKNVPTAVWGSARRAR